MKLHQLAAQQADQARGLYQEIAAPPLPGMGEPARNSLDDNSLDDDSLDDETLRKLETLAARLESELGSLQKWYEKLAKARPTGQEETIGQDETAGQEETAGQDETAGAARTRAAGLERGDAR